MGVARRRPDESPPSYQSTTSAPSRRIDPLVRMQAQFPNFLLVHSPIHAIWLNQIEIYFSIVQRKALTQNDFQSLRDVETRLLDFQRYYEQIATLFEWRFSRGDLAV